MREPPTATSWKITCDSAEEAQALQQWLASRIDLERVITDTVRVTPNGIEQVQTVPHRLGDYFASIQMLPTPEPNPPSFRLVFQRRLEAGRFWKDLMVNILQELEAAPQKAAVELKTKETKESVQSAPRFGRVLDCFKHDFDSTFRIDRQLTARKEDGSPLELSARMYLDVITNTKFASFYIANESDALIAGMSILADPARNIGLIEEGLGFEFESPTTVQQSIKDMIFTRKIIFYFECFLPIAIREKLLSFAHQHQLLVEIRDLSYAQGKQKEFEKELQRTFEPASKPILFVEGKTDKQYIQTALETYQKDSILARLDIRSIAQETPAGAVFGGKKALNNTFAFLQAQPDFAKNPVILLYDSDANKPNRESGNVYVRSCPSNPSNDIITKGIENLFPKNVFEPRFIKEFPRPDAPRKCELIDKTDFCEYICVKREASTEEQCRDFANFQAIIQIIEKVIGVL